MSCDSVSLLTKWAYFPFPGCGAPMRSGENVGG